MSCFEQRDNWFLLCLVIIYVKYIPNNLTNFQACPALYAWPQKCFKSFLNLKNVGTVDPKLSDFYSFDPKKIWILDLNVSTNICRFYDEYWAKSSQCWEIGNFFDQHWSEQRVCKQRSHCFFVILICIFVVVNLAKYRVIKSKW